MKDGGMVSQTIGGFLVDWTGLRTRRKVLRGSGWVGVDVLVLLPGVDRHESVNLVRRAVAEAGLLGEGASMVSPNTVMHATMRGVALWVEAPWQAGVERLAEALAGAGLSGTITPQTGYFDDDSLRGLPPVPTMFIAMTQVPRTDQGPMNQYGVPVPRWGVPPQATRSLADQAVSFVLTPSADDPDGDAELPTGALGEGTTYTLVDARDAADAICGAVERLPSVTWVMLRHTDRTTNQQAREPSRVLTGVSLDTFGQTTWSLLDPAPPLARVARLVDIARQQLPNLDYAAVRASSPLFAGHGMFQGTPWRGYRHLWTEYLPDANPIQIVTSAHLKKAHDLADWDLEPLGDDRWLLQTRDAARWFDLPADTSDTIWYPHTDYYAKAVVDFGDMIMSRSSPLEA
jgi:hypothetical protein